MSDMDAAADDDDEAAAMFVDQHSDSDVEPLAPPVVVVGDKIVSPSDVVPPTDARMDVLQDIQDLIDCEFCFWYPLSLRIV